VDLLAFEGVAADEFAEGIGFVGWGAGERAHFVEHDGCAGFGGLEGGFAAGEACSDDLDGGQDSMVVNSTRL
jgi:hypothetical protein